MLVLASIDHTWVVSSEHTLEITWTIKNNSNKFTQALIWFNSRRKKYFYLIDITFKASSIQIIIQEINKKKSICILS